MLVDKESLGVSVAVTQEQKDHDVHEVGEDFPDNLGHGFLFLPESRCFTKFTLTGRLRWCSVFFLLYFFLCDEKGETEEGVKQFSESSIEWINFIMIDQADINQSFFFTFWTVVVPRTYRYFQHKDQQSSSRHL